MPLCVSTCAPTLFSGFVFTAENAGQPLHLVHTDGRLRRAFGSMDAVLAKFLSL